MTSPADDPFLAFIPDPELSGFCRLPLEEQRWRARIYCVSLVWSGSAPFSWAIAIDRDPDQIAEMKAFLATTPDEWIMEGLAHIGGVPNGSL